MPRLEAVVQALEGINKGDRTSAAQCFPLSLLKNLHHSEGHANADNLNDSCCKVTNRLVLSQKINILTLKVISPRIQLHSLNYEL